MRRHRLPLACLFLLVCLTVSGNAQTAATGSVTISGTLQGPIYPCGSSSCPTYDSGQIIVTVGGFSATTNYSRTANQRNANQLASALANSFNVAASPVTASASAGKI